MVTVTCNGLPFNSNSRMFICTFPHGYRGLLFIMEVFECLLASIEDAWQTKLSQEIILKTRGEKFIARAEGKKENQG